MTDAEARVRLPNSFADSPVIVEQVSETEVRVRKAGVAPADDPPFAESLRPLSDRDRDTFLTLLGRPPQPNAAFRRAADRHHRR
jgi:hypothetical protein